MINWRRPTIFALLHLSGSKIPKYLKEIRKIEKFSEKEIKQYQQRKLKKILLYSWRNVPFYKKTLTEARVVVNGHVNLDNFSKIPFLTKDIIRKEGKNLYSREKRKGVYENTSGGSTGEPVRFLQDKEYDEWNNATKLYFFNDIFGKKIGEPEINLWGSERDIYKNSIGLKERAINYLYNRSFLNAFELDEEKLNNCVDTINKKKPTSMWVYVESIEVLAKFIQKKDFEIHSPKFIITTAGTLYPQARRLIEKIFNCFVYDQYGSREVGPIAIECNEKSGLHEFFWMNYIEVINGKILITTYNNFSMPLVRYDIGDIGKEEKNYSCSCGLNNLKLKEITGREISHFKKRGGGIIHGQYFIHQFYHKDWIKKFQIIQQNFDDIVFNVVLTGKRNEEDIAEIDERIRLIMGRQCNIKWNIVKEIKPTKSGKYLYTVCRIL
jgi:phenylacetate-CoA ligase